MQNNYNLIDEKWIPTNIGLVGLRDCFNNKNIKLVGRTPSEIQSIISLLSSIAHASHCFNNENKFEDSCFIEDVNCYLNTKHELFYLYGDKPFLQHTALCQENQKNKKAYGDIRQFLKGVSFGNNAIYSDVATKRNIFDNDKALLLLDCVSGNAATTKINMNSNSYVKITTVEDYLKFFYNEKIGVSVQNGNHYQYINGYVFCETLAETIYYNMFTNDYVTNYYSNGIGTPPWELNLTETNYEYGETYMSELIPMNMFVLIEKNSDNFYRTEGIVRCYNEGYIKNQFSKFPLKSEEKTYPCLILRETDYGFGALVPYILSNNGTWNKQIENALDNCNCCEYDKDVVVFISGNITETNNGLCYQKDFVISTLRGNSVDFSNSDCLLKMFEIIGDFKTIKDNLIKQIDKLNNKFSKENSSTIYKIPKNLLHEQLNEILVNFEKINRKKLWDYCLKYDFIGIEKIYNDLINIFQKAYEKYCNNTDCYLRVKNEKEKTFYFLEWFWNNCYPYKNVLMKNTYNAKEV